MLFRFSLLKLNPALPASVPVFEEKFGVSKIHLPDQHGNYRETLRENNDVLERLGWEPKDRLKNYIQNL